MKHTFTLSAKQAAIVFDALDRENSNDRSLLKMFEPFQRKPKLLNFIQILEKNNVSYQIDIIRNKTNPFKTIYTIRIFESRSSIYDLVNMVGREMFSDIYKVNGKKGSNGSEPQLGYYMLKTFTPPSKIKRNI